MMASRTTSSDKTCSRWPHLSLFKCLLNLNHILYLTQVADTDMTDSFLQMLCGTEPHPKDFKAKKYRLERHSLSKEDFVHIMKNLPVFFPTTVIMIMKISLQ